jgi:succinoglycan biosynthesis transport protein ExoP
VVQGHLTEEALVIDLDQLWRNLRARAKQVVGAALLFAILGTVFSFMFYEDKYQSVGTLLFNTNEATKVITNIDTGEEFLKSEGMDANPYKNQEELLKSRLIAQRVWLQLKKENLRALSGWNVDQLLNKVLSAEQVKGTNLIRLTAAAHSAMLAQKINDAYMACYLDLINDISSDSLKQSQKMLETQVAQAERDLDTINRKIRDYQDLYGILDMDVEKQNQVGALISLDSSVKAVEADFSQKRAEAMRIRSQLKLKNQDLHTLLQSVATGQDIQLSNLQDKLQELQKDYAAKALIYAPTNPDMQQLQKRIDVLKRQITDQHILTIGQVGVPKSGSIKDSVRTDLVSRLALAESDASALQNKLGTMRSQYQNMHASLQDLPQHELDYARLQMEQKSKTDVLSRLRQNLSEVQIQRASIHQKLMVIDKPNLPNKPVSMPRWQIIALAALAGALLSTSLVSVQTLAKPPSVRPEFVENVLELPVLAMIPWIPNEQWQHYRSRGRLEVTSAGAPPQLVKAYHDLALNLKVQRNATQRSALVLSSLLHNAENSVIMANVAFCLAQSGERVLLVDASLRKPRLHQIFNHALNYENGLPELINSISDVLYRKKEVVLEDILPLIAEAATPSGIHPQLDYLNAGLALEQTFEFLNSKGFAALIQASKAGYDWVLVDCPPFLEQPDASILLGYLDGLLLLVEKDADEVQIAAAQNKVMKLNSSIPGVVLRRPTRD